MKYFLGVSSFIPLVCRILLDPKGKQPAVGSGFIFGTQPQAGGDQCVVLTATDAIVQSNGEPLQRIWLHFFHESDGADLNAGVTVEANFWEYSKSPANSGSRILPMPIPPSDEHINGFLMFGLYTCEMTAIRNRWPYPALFGIVPSISATSPSEVANVNIIHHSGVKCISLRAEVKDTAEASFTYALTTMPDARGAPVFNDAWELIGLHLGSGYGSVATLQKKKKEDTNNQQRV